ncbi:PEP-CTERM sorting domain-containing protein [Pseudoduganella eburnea]|uniref:PEP-CTERM sorting domain-containing protein n=1 Tax=Massilia eburnea TaxID=1776165 RepID=A0A6L6QPZ9_9BURK|nr:PEP-CTERM sorting domain-containing protein [Massilia eburnea]MTW13756.1 PEP-CTERM sorting domain-containing protein [Massilia eburnea]
MCAIARKLLMAAASLVLAASAFGATVIGNASTHDVTLNGADADAFVFTPGWNPHSGPNGDTSGFGCVFDGFGSGPWTLLDRYGLNAAFSNAGALQFGFAMNSGTAGTWSVHNAGAAGTVLDLVLAMHAGDGGAGFLFNDLAINAGQTLNGSWRIEWFTGNNLATPDFSNLALFARNVAAVPEPGEYLMLLLGLGVLVLARRDRAA